jgi:hypothetical protein
MSNRLSFAQRESRIASCYIFTTKIPNLIHFWGLGVEIVGIFDGHFMTIGIFCGNLVSPFWYVDPRKIWHPCTIGLRDVINLQCLRPPSCSSNTECLGRWIP